MPLAIELAAARVRALSLEEIVGGLHDRFRLLTGGARTAVRRQQTLRASVDWSHALLTEPEKILFRRLAVFLGGFDLDRSHQLLATIDGRQHQVGKNLYLADAHRNRLILADIRHDVVLALQLDEQETDDTVVLQLFANRSDQNWAHFSSAPDST